MQRFLQWSRNPQEFQLRLQGWLCDISPPPNRNNHHLGFITSPLNQQMLVDKESDCCSIQKYIFQTDFPVFMRTHNPSPHAGVDNQLSPASESNSEEESTPPKTYDSGESEAKPREQTSPKSPVRRVKKISRTVSSTPNTPILTPNRKVGHWSTREKQRYHWFLELYHSHFQHKQKRRMDKIFKTMADFIGTRGADQCRSHHQKMEKKYGLFYRILYNLRMMHNDDVKTQVLQDCIRAQQETLVFPEQLLDESVIIAGVNSPVGQAETAAGENHNISQNFDFGGNSPLLIHKFSLEENSPNYFDYRRKKLEQPLVFVEQDIQSCDIFCKHSA